MIYRIGCFLHYAGPVLASWATVAACAKYLLAP
jgi:hypothetical protein